MRLKTRTSSTVLQSLHWYRTAHFDASTSSLLPPAFAFDIDGVLKRGSYVLPAAIRAIKKLWNPDGSKPILPVAFITNGGGVTEARKAEQLSTWLNVNVDESQVVCSHTPFRSLERHFIDQPVLVVGRGDVVNVAKSYGFQKVVSTLELAQSYPLSVPFWQEKAKYVAENLPKPTFGSMLSPIRMVKVYSDPSDWYLDLQIVTDVVCSGGVIGRRQEDVPPNTPPVEVVFSNPDLLWANEHPVPRFGQGAFAAALDALHQQVAGGKPLPVKAVFGKPNPPPYRLVEEILTNQAHDLGLIDLPKLLETASSPAHRPPPFSAIFAVGDNPAADVRGANAAGPPWVSVLVKTGVFKADKQQNCSIDPAHIVVEDVEAAVDAGLHRARSIKWHSMR